MCKQDANCRSTAISAISTQILLTRDVCDLLHNCKQYMNEANDQMFHVAEASQSQSCASNAHTEHHHRKGQHSGRTQLSAMAQPSLPFAIVILAKLLGQEPGGLLTAGHQ